jgi:hypothetical protein
MAPTGRDVTKKEGLMRKENYDQDDPSDKPQGLQYRFGNLVSNLVSSKYLNKDKRKCLDDVSISF